ncbi:MAG: hypothetical protein C4519_13495 [Desulfobacteraceae bacterium]|nr:MAG: hypothetical protein C4519_13495 [Desulfobacteraceae bacterium]
MKGLKTSMSGKDNNRDGLKSLLDQWNVEFDGLSDIDDDAMKDLKQSLENTWTVFEQRFNKK